MNSEACDNKGSTDNYYLYNINLQIIIILHEMNNNLKMIRNVTKILQINPMIFIYNIMYIVNIRQRIYNNRFVSNHAIKTMYYNL